MSVQDVLHPLRLGFLRSRRTAVSPAAGANAACRVEPLEPRQLLTVTADVSASGSAYEGSPFTATLSAYLSDSSSYSVHTIQGWSVNWGDDTPNDWYTFGSYGLVTHVYADGDASHTITATAYASYLGTSSGGTESSTDSESVIVQNVEPSFSVSGADTVYRDETYSLYRSAVSDPGVDTVGSWAIAWGDGTTSTYAGNAEVFPHAYTSKGDYSITATAVDEDGSYSRGKSVKVINPTVTIGAPDVWAYEGSADYATFTVSRDGPTTRSLDVSYSVSGTATPGDDYTPLSGQVTIGVGQSAASFSVVALADTDALETDESIEAAVNANPLYELTQKPVTRQARVAVAGRNGFINNGRTEEKVSHWVKPAPLAGGKGNQDVGSIKSDVPPEIVTGTDDAGVTWARVKLASGVLVVERSYTGQKPGDQGVGEAGSLLAGKRVYISAQLARDLDAHEAGHVTASSKIYAQTLKLAEDAAAKYRNENFTGTAGESEAQVKARLEATIKWAERKQAFINKDTAVNGGNGPGTFHGWESDQGGGPTDQHPVAGDIDGVHYDLIYKSRKEAEPNYTLPNYALYDPWAP